MKENDAIAVGSLGIVIHSPNVGGFGKFLFVDDGPLAAKAGLDSQRNHILI
ncbi:hypothetical protein GWN26_01730 [Candidatus Saccharibacteria bacterium]|nr:hypothetical protein [Candidatus Saccharibacteria bacterium]NIV03252.1 hypothetical protein [Calditrichia bacterium]NIV97925.1 hypothetical protein [Candidatus Saccharibacteria bacterium]